MSASAHRRLHDPRYLVGHWPLNGHAQDVSGHGYHGTVSGMTYAAGPFGHTVGSFDGVNDSVNIGDVTQLNSASQITIAFWMKQRVLDVLDYFFIKGGGTSLVQLLSGADGNFYFGIRDGADNYIRVDYSTLTSANRWTHVGCVFDGTQSVAGNRYALLFDGRRVGTVEGTPPSATPNMAGVDATISLSSNALDGELAHFRIYSCALTGDEVAALAEYDTR